MLTMEKMRPLAFQGPYKSLLSTMDVFQNISSAALQEIEKQMTVKKYARRKSIYLEDDPAQFVWFVTRGHVKEVKHSPDGKDQTIGMVGANGMFGLSAFDGGTYEFHSIAETDAEVLSMPIRDFRSMMQKHPDIGKAVVSKISTLLRQSKMMQTFFQKSVEKRLLHVLVELAGEFGDTIPLTRREIASMAGTSVETCIRIFARLQADQLIKAEYRRFTIKNPERLKRRIEVL